MCNEHSNKEAGREESPRQEVHREKDAISPKKPVVIEDQEDNNTTEKSRTGSLHINDCKLNGSIKNVSEIKEGDAEIDGIVLDPEDGSTDIQETILNEVKIQENIIITNSGGETGRVSTLTIREALIYKKLTKSDLFSSNGLRFPGKEVREKLLPHISAPALLEKNI
ncbi:uncharacterized protein LOC129882629 [Solanum dulcamara]|uniref:uncharacterized protein LOC129882629 n=1 Tax=Solanum dulcamara TaxID=45834 RepID=UPI002484F0BC|nr:uncharacterized protein LOC129882629 [Solanum dulcamara]